MWGERVAKQQADPSRAQPAKATAREGRKPCLPDTALQKASGGRCWSLAAAGASGENPCCQPAFRTQAAFPPSLHTRARRDMVRTVYLLNRVQGTQPQRQKTRKASTSAASPAPPRPEGQRPDVALWHCEAPGSPVKPTLDPEEHSLVPLPLTRPAHPGWGHGSQGVAAPRHRGAMVSSSLTEDSLVLPFSILGQKMGARLGASQAAVVSSTWLPQVC